MLNINPKRIPLLLASVQALYEVYSACSGDLPPAIAGELPEYAGADGGNLLLELDDLASELRDARAQADGAILLPFTLADSTCFDLMCTASEGGINYWADIIKRKGQRRADSEIPDIVSFEADVQDGPVTCDHPEIEAAEIGRFTIDPDMIRAGVRRLLAPDAQISPAIRNDCAMQLTDPEHAADADTADAIVQFAVFGELVFG